MIFKSYRRRLTPVVILLLLALTACFIPQYHAYASSTTFRYKIYPQGMVGLTRPVIGFQFVKADFQITQNDTFTLKLDNTLVNGSFDPQTTTFSYTPTSDLKPGEHKVELFFQISGYSGTFKNWTFTVADQAVRELPSAPTSEQKQGIDAINDYRKLFGLPPLQWNKELSQAASSHASYLLANKVDADKVSMHDETSSNPGYTGATPMQRAGYVNYRQGGVGEDVSYSGKGFIEAIDSLFDAPYHRLPFLLQEATDIGIDKEGDFTVIEFGLEKEVPSRLIVSPAPGDRYVPISFNGHERPDPLSIHGGEASYPVGYPLLAVVTGAQIDKLMLDEASLTDGNGNSVEFLRDTPNNDKELHNAIILIPKAPLQPDSRYNAKIKVSFTENGQEKSLKKSWGFQTEPAATVGKKKLHADSDAYKKQTEQASNNPHVVTFNLQEKRYILDGISLPAKMKPVVINGSSYLWVRDLASALGATVTWDDTNKAAVYSKAGKTVTFHTTRDAYAASDGEHTTETPAKLLNNTTLIPVRLMSEVLGAKVEYDDASKTIKITY